MYFLSFLSQSFTIYLWKEIAFISYCKVIFKKIQKINKISRQWKFVQLSERCALIAKSSRRELSDTSFASLIPDISKDKASLLWSISSTCPTCPTNFLYITKSPNWKSPSKIYILKLLLTVYFSATKLFQTSNYVQLFSVSMKKLYVCNYLFIKQTPR